MRTGGGPPSFRRELESLHHVGGRFTLVRGRSANSSMTVNATKPDGNSATNEMSRAAATTTSLPRAQGRQQHPPSVVSAFA